MKSNLSRGIIVACISWLPLSLCKADCVDSVVLVHGNGSDPSSWAETVDYFVAHGYRRDQILLPVWGNPLCVACNDHREENVAPVREAINSALKSSCSGRIDVIAHSMGVTIAMKAILEEEAASRVDAFVGIAGGQHGINSCGIYPFNIPTSTCAENGLSVGSPLVVTLQNRRYGARMVSILSYFDEVACAGVGGCFVNGAHTSNIDGQDNSIVLNSLGHFLLQTDTAEIQYRLIR